MDAVTAITATECSELPAANKVRLSQVRHSGMQLYGITIVHHVVWQLEQIRRHRRRNKDAGNIFRKTRPNPLRTRNFQATPTQPGKNELVKNKSIGHSFEPVLKMRGLGKGSVPILGF